MPKRILLSAFAVVLMSACGTADLSPTDGRVESAGPARVLDTLLLLVSVETDGSEDQEYFESLHVTAVKLEIDGVEWGTFAPKVHEGDATPSPQWAFTNEPDPALVVARLGAGDAAPRALRTVGDWVSELQRRLRVGDHVARIIRADLRNGDGEELSIEPGTLVPFSVAPGESSAWIADLVLTAPTLEVAQ